jgi:hypothetical protein
MLAHAVSDVAHEGEIRHHDRTDDDQSVFHASAPVCCFFIIIEER